VNIAPKSPARLAIYVAISQDGFVIEVRNGGRRRIDRVLAPEFVAGLAQRPLGEVRALRDDAAQEETDLSYLRRMLHGRIDIVRAEQQRRADGVADDTLVDQLATILSHNAIAPSRTGRFSELTPSRAEAHRRHVEALLGDVDLSDVGALPEEKLQLALTAYASEEGSVSGLRRRVQKVVDRLNDEIAARYRSGTANVDDIIAAERHGA
jgi:hypothetical protein